MKRRRTPAVVGAFVIAGIAVAVIAVVLIGSGRVFRDTESAVVYFDRSVNGLLVGAPVKFKGIPVGEVDAMRIDMSRVAAQPGDVSIAVGLTLDEGWASDGATDGSIRELVGRGLRAQLETESLLTNVKYVALDMKPETPAMLAATRGEERPEIPVIPTELQQIETSVRELVDRLAEVDYQELARSIKALSRRVSSLIEGGPPTAGDLLDPQLYDQLFAAVEEVERAARSVRRLADQLSRDPGSLLRGGRQ